MRAYWMLCKRGRNFGDALTPLLYRRLCEETLEWAPRETAEMFGCGSILGHIPPGYRGMVWGTGLMWERKPVDLSTARILALRGPLSAAACRIPDSAVPVYADPGLLCADLLPWLRKYRRDQTVGTIRHYVDTRPAVGLRIDVLSGVGRVIEQATRCAEIISSSLHGIILADSLGIPSRWDPHPDVRGDGFKFRDYAASFGQEIQPNVLRLAPAAAVREKRAALRAAARTAILQSRR